VYSNETDLPPSAIHRLAAENARIDVESAAIDPTLCQFLTGRIERCATICGMRYLITIAFAGVVVSQLGCSKQSPAAPAAQAASATAFDTSIDTKQLMRWVIDPTSKLVFGAVASVVTESGEEQIQPRTDEEWNTVRNNAAMVLESGNLLMLDSRARPSSVQDLQDWNAKAQAMSVAARAAIEATEAKDPEALFTASGDIYQACTDCHSKYIFSPAPDAQQ
jgi:hypothetical protein